VPFAYFGAKHKLASGYDPPLYDTIIEPFAGSAGYSCRWASHSTRIILVEKDARVVELWRELQEMTPAGLDLIESQLADDRCTHPFLGALAGSKGLAGALSGKSQKVTPRMSKDWPSTRSRIEKTLLRLRSWEIIHGDYTDAPDTEATWLIDPPYQPLLSDAPHAAGNAYREGAQGIDYQYLANWCRTRRGQVMVCEQEPAAWLPFVTHQTHMTATGIERVEVLWKGDVVGVPSLF